MKFTYYGHSCFAVETNLPDGQAGGKKLLFDPFISGNEQAKHIDINSIEADYILVSHGHWDHIDDCIALAQATGAKVISNAEISDWLKKNGVVNVHSMNTGGKWNFGSDKKINKLIVRCTVAQHSSSFTDGLYAGNPMGFIIESGEGCFYYSGDTALTLDMQLIPKWAKLNFAVLPIGDNFTMGYKDALEAARFIECRTVVGVHYDTFEPIKIKDKAKVVKAFKKAGYQLHLLETGNSILL